MWIILTKENIEDLPGGILEKERVREELETNPFGKYLLYVENNVLAYLYYSDIYDRVEINQFEVKKEKRNCGLGNKVLKKFTEIVDKSITLEVREDNEEARHLYKKYGFKEIAVREKYYQGKDGILMEKSDK